MRFLHLAFKHLLNTQQRKELKAMSLSKELKIEETVEEVPKALVELKSKITPFSDISNDSRTIHSQVNDVSMEQKYECEAVSKDDHNHLK